MKKDGWGWALGWAVGLGKCHLVHCTMTEDGAKKYVSLE